jgi:hypothetical protein
MKTAAALVILLGGAAAIGQQPAAPPAGPAPGAQQGGRGGTPLSPAQAAAVTAANVDTALQAQIRAAAAAQTALLEASLTQPVNQADLRAKAQALADAETKLALARADLLVTVQQALRPLDTTQAIAALSGRAGGGGRGGPPVPDNYDGFVSLFDGRTLEGWNGDPMFWSVKDGALHAESTPEKVVGGVIPGNTFLIWKGKVRDFELKVDYRFVGNGNSGVQIRSRMSGPQGGAERPWGVSGYQLDMVTAGGTGSGVFYTEGGGFGLTPQGMAMRAFEGPDRAVQMRQIGSLGTSVADAIKPGPDWNTYHIIAHNNLIVAFINGRMVAMLVDDNRSGAQYARDGLLALQMHAGQPFSVEFKNVYLKEIKPENLPATPLPAGQGRGGGRQ